MYVFIVDPVLMLSGEPIAWLDSHLADVGLGFIKHITLGHHSVLSTQKDTPNGVSLTDTAREVTTVFRANSTLIFEDNYCAHLAGVRDVLGHTGRVLHLSPCRKETDAIYKKLALKSGESLYAGLASLIPDIPEWWLYASLYTAVITQEGGLDLYCYVIGDPELIRLQGLLSKLGLVVTSDKDVLQSLIEKVREHEIGEDNIGRYINRIVATIPESVRKNYPDNNAEAALAYVDTYYQ